MFKNYIFKKRQDNGFTLIELIIVIGMSMILFGIFGLNLVRFQSNNSAQSNVNVLVSDLKTQQLKAMLGSTEGRSANDSYGIYFLSDRYILFHGTVYDSNDASNFEVILPQDLEIDNTTFPSNTIVFTKLSGEIPGFVDGSNTVTVRSVNTNQNTIITLNRYGVITGID